MSDDLDRRIEAYLDGSLGAEDAVELARLVRAGGRSEISRKVAFAGLLVQSLDPTDGQAIARSVLARIDAEDSASGMVRAVQRGIAPRRRRRRTARPLRFAWLTAVAALLALGLLWWLGPSASGDGRIASIASGSARIGTADTAAGPGSALRLGDVVRFTGPATVRWKDGSEIAMDGGGITMQPPGPGRGLRLDAGALEAVIAAQPTDAPFAIATATARIEVVGTRFRLEASGVGTRCDLHDGSVRLTCVADGRSLVLRPGQSAVVADGISLVHGERAWRPLFPSGALAQWRQQHGAWSATADGIRGSSPDGGKARILSLAGYADLELACRLRITGADFAEIQVGDYNWFFEIPARRGAWTEVHLRQRGGELVCSADGVQLAAQPGAGVAARRGPLAFYIMPGGTLEIADARILTPDDP